jgi:RNA polymerase sigma factor (sigma-70 family)
MIQQRPMASDENPDAQTGTATLLSRIRRGDSIALSQLFRREGDALRRWARGKLPAWIRNFTDSVDMVQETLFQTFQRLNRFENRGRGSLQAYLRRGVRNRIADAMRSFSRRRTVALDDQSYRVPSPGPSPYDHAEDAERTRRYKVALKQLNDDEQLLVVGCLELGQSYEQLALVTGRATPGAARIAARRAVKKLANILAGD